MLIKNFYFGSIDAKHELLNNDPDIIDRFRKSFLVPYNVDTDDFVSGESFIVTGLKGTGKTALLRYIDLKTESLGAKREFVLFKSDFSEEDKKQLSRGVNITEVNTDGKDINDYENIWKWFIYRILVNMVEDKNTFYNTPELNYFISCIKSVETNEAYHSRKILLPKLKKGAVELSADYKRIKGKISLDFEFRDNETKASFASVLRECNKYLERLKPNGSGTPIYLFFDELEISIGNTKQTEKDIKLIRDLIVSVSNLNLLFKKLKYNIFIIIAIRSEVLNKVGASGKEINKIVEDFGVPLCWHQKGGNIEYHPLLQIICKRIISSTSRYRKAETHKEETYKNVWNQYIPGTIQYLPSPNYVLHQTWYRPRDVVRLFGLMQKNYPNETYFGHNCFDGVRKDYAQKSWVELKEELSSSYSPIELRGIEHILYYFRRNFSHGDFVRRINELKDDRSEVKVLIERKNPTDVLSDLFRIGLIGNYYEAVDRGNRRKYFRWSFRGDDEIILDQNLVIHNGVANNFGYK